MKLIDKLSYFFALPFLAVIIIVALSRPSSPKSEPVLSAQDISYLRMDLLKNTVLEIAKDPNSIEFLQEYYSEQESKVWHRCTTENLALRKTRSPRCANDLFHIQPRHPST